MSVSTLAPAGARSWNGKLDAAIKHDAAQVEVYSTGRYLTITGHRIAGTPNEILAAPKTLELLRARVDAFKAIETKAKVETSGEKNEPPRQARGSSGDTFWRRVNAMAFDHLDVWVPVIFGDAAVYQPGTGAWRVSSAELGRGLEEDLSIHPDGATDWGTREGLTAIDLVQRYGNAGSAKAAALWLCQRGGVEPATLGWDEDYSGGLKSFAATVFGGGAAQAKASRARGPTAHEARKYLQKRLAAIVEQALSRHEFWIKFDSDDHSDAPHSAIKVETGVGKSELLRQAVALQYIPEAKRRSLPHRVLKLVPTHKLAGEARERMPAGVTVAVWQGRGGIHLETGEPMCRNPEAVKAALDVGGNVEKTACRSKTARCPFYYQQQKPAARTADVIYAAHEILFQMPKALGQGFGLVVVDESFWPDGLTIKSRLVINSLADELAEFPVRNRETGARLDYETTHLRELIERLQAALDKMPDGYVQRAPLIEAGLVPRRMLEESSCKTARDLEWMRKNKVKTGLLPGANDDVRQKAVRKFGFFGRLPRRAAMWRHLEDLIAGSDDATGRLLIETIETKEGPQRYLRILGRKEIAEKLLSLPLIVADATLPLDLVQHFLPNLQLSCDLKVEAPHMKVTQAAGLPVGKASLQQLPPGKRSTHEEARAGRKRKRLADTCRHLARGRRALVVTYKSIEEAFAGIEGTETGHFNAIEGVDAWRNVDVLVTIGRPLPRSKDIERLAAAVTGLPVIAGPIVEEFRPIGPGHRLQCRVYGEPAAEMVRQAVTEAAIEQAVGRARGVNRTAANPVEVYVILNDTVVPSLPVDEVVTFQSLEPDAVDHMVMRGLVPQSGTDATRLHPDLFPNPMAAKKAIQRAGLDVVAGTRQRAASGVHKGTSSYRNIFIRRCPLVARYQTFGARQRPRLIRFDPIKFPDLRAVLEAALGPLVLFAVLAGSAPEAAAEAAE